MGQQSLRMPHETRDGLGIGHCTPRSARAGKSGVQRHQDVMHVCRATDELTVVGKPHGECVRLFPTLGGDVGQSLTHATSQDEARLQGPVGIALFSSPSRPVDAAAGQLDVSRNLVAPSGPRRDVRQSVGQSDMVSSTPSHSKDGKQLTKSASITAQTPLAGS